MRFPAFAFWVVPVLGGLGLAMALGGCVSRKKLAGVQTQLQVQRDSCRTELARRDAQIANLLQAKASLEDSLYRQNTRLDKLRADLREETQLVRSLNEDLQQLKTQSSREILDLIGRLELTRQDLYNRELRLSELQHQLRTRTAALANLQQNLRDALLAYPDSALTVQTRDGRVYVALSNQLLFKPGETTPSAAGTKALAEVARVLARQTQWNVAVEGHTDNQPVRNIRCLQDNWDLSVLRATHVLRVLVEQGVAPQRLVATGCGEYRPKAANQTPAGRSQNRRTELVLMPNTGDVLKLLEDYENNTNPAPDGR